MNANGANDPTTTFLIGNGAVPPHADNAEGVSAVVALSTWEEVPPRFCHHRTKQLLAWSGGALRWVEHIPVFGRALIGFGPGLVLALNATEFLSKGMASNILFYSFLPMFLYRFECGTVEYQRLYSVGGMGWSVKPLVAVLSDSMAFFGYRRRWLLFLSAVVGGICCFAYALMPRGNASAVAGIIFYTVANYCMANIDILTEGLYSRKIRHIPAEGVFLISSMWWMSMLGGTIGAFIQGPLSDQGHATVGGWVAGGCLFLVLPVFAWNWLEEQPNHVEREEDRKDLYGTELVNSLELQINLRDVESPVVSTKDTRTPSAVLDGEAERVQTVDLEVEDNDNENNGNDESARRCCTGLIDFNRNVFHKQFRLVVLCFILTAAVLGLAVVTMQCGIYTLLGTSVGASVLVVVFMFWALPTVIAKAGFYSFMSHVVYININGPLNSFYLAAPSCVPRGPHFDLFFFYSVSAAVGNLAGLLGVTLFAYLFSRQPYRITFLITTVLRAVASVFDLILVQRWNRAAGIPDGVLYVMGDAVVFQLVYRLSWMPMTILIAQLCPKGSEAMVYAVLAAMTNLGGTMASELTSLLLELVWPIRSNVPCDYSNLWKLVVAGHLVLPLFVCPLIFWCIPHKRVCDPFR